MSQVLHHCMNDRVEILIHDRISVRGAQRDYFLVPRYDQSKFLLVYTDVRNQFHVSSHLPEAEVVHVFYVERQCK